MIQLLTPDCAKEFAAELDAMHRLRARVFAGRLGWEVAVVDGREIDCFDACGSTYLLQRGVDGSVQGCVRLLPSTGPIMLREAFPELLAGRSVAADPLIWESSRFAVDLPPVAPKAACGLALATVELFAGMLEFGLARQLTDIVTVTDLRVERLLRRAGWPLRRIAAPCPVGITMSVAGHLAVSRQALSRVRQAGPLERPVLWAPVLTAGSATDRSLAADTAARAVYLQRAGAPESPPLENPPRESAPLESRTGAAAGR
jgi:acyl homoserine lactone synthase